MQRRSNRTILCLARVKAGRLFHEEAKRLGCRVIVLTEESARHEGWPSCIDRLECVGSLDNLDEVRRTVQWIAESEPIDRVVANLEREVGIAARVREWLGVPGQTVDQARVFRDKLAMRMQALHSGVAVPIFAPAADGERVAHMLSSIQGPYVLKIRDGLGASDVTRLESAEEVFPAIASKADPDRYLLEQYMPGDVYHVDSLIYRGTAVFASVSRYGLPMLDLMRGGNFVSFTIDRHSDMAKRLAEANQKILSAFGLERGVSHIEFIVAHDGTIYFLEAASRLAAARIPWVIDQATGVCMYHEWAKLEAFDDYTPPKPRSDYAGIITTVPKHGPADLSPFSDARVVWKSTQPYIPSLIVRDSNPQHVESLLREYDQAFRQANW